MMVIMMRPLDDAGAEPEVTEHDDPRRVITLTLEAVRAGGLAVGIGAGHRSAHVLAAKAARGARAAPWCVQVRGEGEPAAAHADAVMAVLADAARRRTGPGWDVVDALRGGATQDAAAAALGVTRQAVSQRALAAGWRHEQGLVPLAGQLLLTAQGAGRAGV